MASAASLKTSMNASPICLTIRPPDRSVQARTTFWKRSTTSAVTASPIASARGVKLTRSMNITVQKSWPRTSVGADTSSTRCRSMSSNEACSQAFWWKYAIVGCMSSSSGWLT